MCMVRECIIHGPGLALLNVLSVRCILQYTYILYLYIICIKIYSVFRAHIFVDTSISHACNA
jgi:hypothetical protein